MMMKSTLYLTNTLSWIFIVLAHWNNNTQIDMLPHSGTLSRFWANQSLLFLLNAVCLAEKQQIPYFCLVWDDWGSNPWSITLEVSTLTITRCGVPWNVFHINASIIRFIFILSLQQLICITYQYTINKS
jgi:hypothetical protein